VLSAGLEPTHLDWHCFRDAGRDDAFELTVELAREYGLAVRASDLDAQQQLKDLGLPANDHPLLDSFELEIDGKLTRYANLLHELPAGLTQWAVHPGGDDTDTRAVDPDGWRVRYTDREFLLSARARELVAEEGIVLLDYGLLQKAWRETSS
jgi:predicted glycoside hydrolase/deacetylase ChbG (UPF0249 family)